MLDSPTKTHSPTPPATSVALRTLATEIAGIEALVACLQDGSDQGLQKPFEAALKAIGALAQTARVIVSGMGKSGHIARKICATLASTGQSALFVHPAEASHGDLGMINQGDLILALSWSGETAELADIITFAHRFKIPLVAMTSNADSTLAKAADIALTLPKAPEACPNGLAPTTSTTMQLAMGDALAIALLEQKGFTAQDFRLFHPGGKLGAKLTFVRDIMHTDARLPRVSPATNLGEAVLQMTSAGFGCVLVCSEHGNLIGIITDGDLRRHMRADLLAVEAQSIMTRAPQTILPEALAVDALEMMQSRKIAALPVVDGQGALCGLLHIHDLLRLGVA